MDTNPPPTTIPDTLKPDLSEYQPGPPAQITPSPTYQFQPSSYYPTEHPPHVQFSGEVYIHIYIYYHIIQQSKQVTYAKGCLHPRSWNCKQHHHEWELYKRLIMNNYAQVYSTGPDVQVGLMKTQTTGRLYCLLSNTSLPQCISSTTQLKGNAIQFQG